MPPNWAPAMMRYQDKPFLQYLDFFVLRAIGELTPQQEALIEEMAPVLAKTYGERSWFEIVATQMNFEEEYASKIAILWRSQQQISLAHGITLDPMEFTQLFVDANFPH
jgi:hypothetical protein